jgi:hypothetical protein
LALFASLSIIANYHLPLSGALAPRLDRSFKKWIEKIIMPKVKLPAIIENTTPILESITKALGVPRNLLASDDEIENAWESLPRLMGKIPPELRNEGLVKMCVAVSTGLFDSAINYIWNSSVIELRDKVKRFGLNVVEQVTDRSNFDAKVLLEMKDAELLTLCLKLNLITEDGYFFLDQCRDIRNNFSAAHPVVGQIDDSEFLSFVNRCAKYALGNESNPIGVDLQAFMKALKGGRFEKEQRTQWVKRVKKTHEAQRNLLLITLHGVYCDPDSNEKSRLNAIDICSSIQEDFTPKNKEDLIDKHSEYAAKGDDKRHKASQQFFEKLKLLSLLDETEWHALISNTCKKLISVHQSFDNFYNEPPFAERLLELSQQGEIPDTVKNSFVESVVMCAIGTQYGTADSAYISYKKMVEGFAPSEIKIMLELPSRKSIIAQRIKSYKRCENKFIDLVGVLDSDSVPTSSKTSYKKWVV